jgi:hypothetical protein
MIGEIILAVAAFVTGMVIPKVMGLHKCKYNVVYHKPISAVRTGGVTHSKASGENFPGQYYKEQNTFITCKQCAVCQERILRISDGSDRTFNFDKEYVLTQIDMEIKKDAEKQEAELLERMNEQLKTPEQRAAEAKIKATEEAHRATLREQAAMCDPPEEETPSDKILAQLNGRTPQAVEYDHSGNIVYVAHRSDGDDVHIVRKKKQKRKMGRMV